jgi:concanavalin A-like lectin/glucanase superfamily protein
LVRVGLAAVALFVAGFWLVLPASGSQPNLVAEWHLDVIQDGTTPDSSGNGLTGAVGQAVTSQAGKFGNAVGLTNPARESGSIAVAANSLFEPANLTVLAWVKRNESPGNLKYILAEGGRQCSAASYALYTGSQGGLVFYIDDGTQARISPDAGPAIWDGNWHAIAGSFDGANVRLYVDGNQIGNGTPAETGIDYGAANGHNLALGAYTNPLCGDYKWSGTLDETRIYNRALNPDEIRQLQTATSTTPPELTPPPPTTTTVPPPTTTPPPPPPTTTPLPPPPPATTPTSQPPIAKLVLTTPKPLAGRLVAFDPTQSRPGQGSITGFAYDFGSGKFAATCPVSTPVAFKVFAAGPTKVSLRVTNSVGVTSLVQLVVNVAAAPAATAPRFHVDAAVAAAGLGSFWCGTPKSIQDAATAYLPALYTSEVHAVGIDITQGVLPTPPKPSGVAIRIRRARGLRTTSTFRQEAVFLNNYEESPADNRITWFQRGGKTVVRVYASAVVAPLGDSVTDVQMKLYGSTDGGALPGSPLLAENGPLDVPFGPPFTTHAMRIGYDPVLGNLPAFTFTLPDSWTRGNLALLAKPVLVGARLDRQCDTSYCALKQDGRLSGIQFHETGLFIIRSVAMTATGDAALPSPASVFDQALNLTPVGAVVTPYQATINIDSIVKAIAACKPSPPPCTTPNDMATALIGQWATDNQASPSSLVKYVTMGIHAGRPAINGYSSWPASCPANANGGALCETSTQSPVSQVDTGRPLSSVGHELFHDLGRPHADGPSSGCGGDGEGKPDLKGHHQGIGLDRHAGSGSGKEPYKIISPDLPGQRGEQYDLMSYCAGSDDPADWLSPHTWDTVAGDWIFFIKRTAAAVQALVEAAARGPALQVSGITTGTNTRILHVEPTKAPMIHGPASSPFHAVARNAAGKAIADVTLKYTAGHLDSGRKGTPATPVAIFEGTVPAATAQLSIKVFGATGTTLRKSAHPPKVALLAPRGGTIGAGPSVPVKWRATDADGNALRAYIDYSTDGGKQWRTVFIASSHGSATVPSRYFTGSSNARVRVRVNDGFDETAASSGRLRALGSAPAITISSPGPGQRFQSDSSVYLSARGFDDAFNVLPRGSFRWFVDRKPIGVGDAVSVTDLPPGRNVIRVVAKDGHGRSGTATVPVTVLAAQPFFLTLQAPSHISRRAKTLSLKVATNVTATLKVAGRSFTLNRKLKAISVHVKPGRSVLRLTLALSSHGRTAARPLQIART